MNGQSWYRMIVAITFVPDSVLFIIFMIIWFWFEKGEDWILMAMRNIITKKSIDQELKYLVCSRILPDDARNHFVFGSIAIVITCVHCTFVIAMIEQTYNCRHDPDLYCFKIDWNLSPINNCSAISKDELVICYRIIAFDPEKTLIGASAGYLLFKILTTCLLVVGHIMVWLAQKWEVKTLQGFKCAFGFILCTGLNIIVYVSIFVHKVESTLQKFSITVLLQIELVILNLVYFVTVLPWEIFKDTDEYYGDASVPSVMKPLLRQSRSSSSYEMM